ncbi:VHL beta domain-containing protein [Pseudoprimorskyibacter insulae]|uniref:von Hippel-Lindau disease tumour suppressor beta domain-containing protein n=1 Tax=Pseudoprimorskyibacter insulae TaxID=1695997 RepID=A0A2R8AWA1_9RHOB|nr:hypothetical protein [Pseudoprimorskyibacter insulae]SPF80316.1 hypothetical protein PRI8871_02119 [Pseudoprimorskyibacter insulae]
MRLISSALALAGLTTVFAAPAQAVDWGQHYASVRDWDVYQSDISGCIAARPSGQMVDMAMLIAPASGFELMFSSSLPNDSLASVLVTIDGRSTHDEYIAVDGWLHGVFDTPLREAMAASSSAEVMIDGLPMTFPMDGVTAALLKLQDCWFDLAQPDPNTSRALPVALPSKSGGQAPGRAPTRPTAAPMVPAVTTTHYDTARDWTVHAEQNAHGFAGCAMTRGPGFDLSLARFGGAWTLRFPFNAPDGTRITADMDLDRASALADLTVLNGVAEGEIGESWVEGIALGRRFFVSLGGPQSRISLSGTAAAITKVEECDMNFGVVPVAQTAVENDALRPGPNCPAMGSMRSPNLQDLGNITFINQTDAAINLYWLDFNGMPQEMGGLLPGDIARFNSVAGHYWLARDVHGTCHGGTIEVPFGDTSYEIR